jgi:hypothetical protein
MAKKVFLGISLVAAVLFLGLVWKSKVWSRLAPGSLQVSALPKSKVWLDGLERGKTPFLDDGVVQGEHQLKLVVEGQESLTWEGRIKVNSGARTVVNRRLSAEGENDSSGEILTLEKTSIKDKAGLAVVSIPDQAVVKIDGQPKGFAPLNLVDLTPGDYQVSVASPGFEEKLLSAHTAAGYKLIINVQLAQKTAGVQAETVVPTGGLTPSPAKTSTLGEKSLGAKTEKPYIVVKETVNPNPGFLRVRETPGGKEIARIKAGESFLFLEKDESGWYKIEYEQDKQGWISSVYADLSE